MAFELTEYPPRSFCEKYQRILAPHGLLLSPKQVLKNKKLGNNVEEMLRKAFKITVKKLKKMRSACANCNEDQGVGIECPFCKAVRYCSSDCLEQRKTEHAKVCRQLELELIDQVSGWNACHPPLSMGRDVMRGRGGLVSDWDDWLTRHTTLRDNAIAAAAVVSEWWHFTPVNHPGSAALQASLERVISNVFSTVLTIGHCPFWVPSLAPEIENAKEIHIHLLGADEPEVSAVQSGVIQVVSRILGRPIVVSLVAPDLNHHPQTFSWTPKKPFQATPSVKAIAYPGLYHDFWREYVVPADKKSNVQRPHIALAIHPGVHTDPMLELWTPTLMLLAYEQIPVAMTTYNLAEFEETLQKLENLKMNIVHKELNPLRSLLAKQTPYEPDHVWATNSYAIGIDNTRESFCL
ncbi:LOW QUALITY PROTEIN: putative protein MSS51 homolog, mitochondrial [Palaemon carinicauda]|uniref:LOW QUALITY PROTEIN: putative protein MSS51 homolog, mitochondrial n=1 Tax=Palaemon carinicauda TaxID=392227 RepID=UPI0035B65913